MNRRFFLIACSAAALAGCQKSGIFDTVEATNSLPYILGSGDRLRIIIFGQDSLSNIYPVDGQGRIAMPLIGQMKVADLTTVKAASLIEGKLRDGFIREPKVTVEIETYRPFFILGEVVNSGQFAYVNGMTIQNAVAIAGGFGPRAARQSAEVTRIANGVASTFTAPLSNPVRPGDSIVIKERWL
jgi:polysaccharide biosynthesis/export protein